MSSLYEKQGTQVFELNRSECELLRKGLYELSRASNFGSAETKEIKELSHQLHKLLVEVRMGHRDHISILVNY